MTTIKTLLSPLMIAVESVNLNYKQSLDFKSLIEKNDEITKECVNALIQMEEFLLKNDLVYSYQEWISDR